MTLREQLENAEAENLSLALQIVESDTFSREIADERDRYKAALERIAGLKYCTDGCASAKYARDALRVSPTNC